MTTASIPSISSAITLETATVHAATDCIQPKVQYSERVRDVIWCNVMKHVNQ